ncbi:MAG TPA: NAD(P)-dependent oxidoreductase [Gemmatimonadales bacterium]|nr:NAD(P)-dependent oxidoreductase [Gemmatimonadales bacterium]
MKVLVTGGAGYVGSTLTPTLLAAGHQVRVFDSLLYGSDPLLGVWSEPGFRFTHGDVRDREAVAEVLQGAEAVVHLAAVVGDPACAREPGLARAVNLDASINLIDLAQRAGVARFIFASTCSNYGRMPDENGLVDENSPLAPVSLYAETKVAVERALFDRRGGGMAVTALRFATVFGVSPRMRYDLTVNEFTRSMILDRHLVVFGGQFWRPYVHVRDVARAVGLVLAAPANRVERDVFNVGDTEQNYQKRRLVELIRPYAPDAVVEQVHREEDPRDYRVSFEKIQRRLGFRITRTVTDGIAEVARLVEAGASNKPSAAPVPA